MKRLTPYIILTAVLLLVIILASCAKDTKEDNGKITIVTTIFPMYDWIREITATCEEDVEIILLNKNGTDLHSFQPSVEDIRKIGSSSLFVYTGGESEEWAEDAVEATSKTQDSVLVLLPLLGDRALEEEHVEGMEEHEHEHEHEHEEEEEELDEHIWLSLKNARYLVNAIAQRLAAIDSKNAETYLKNAASYIEKLGALDKEYENTVRSSALNTLIFADRFPFLYMVKDYGLEYYAAFSGCSAETEASFNTIIFLASKTDSTKTDSVLIIENSDDKLAQTVIANTAQKNQKILVLNSLQSVRETDIENGMTYLSIMEQNLEVLKEALN